MASTPNDPFAKPVLVAGLALLAAAVFVLVSNLLHTIQKNSTVGSDDSAMIEIAAQNNLAPIGTVVAVDKSVAPVARSGEAVYNAVCTACHASGVLGAPKLEKAAWTERVAKGLEGLLDNAINGFNQMPARGGDPSITDEEMKSAVLYMTGEAGLDLAGGAKNTDAASDETAATVETAEVVAETEQTTTEPEPAQTATEQTVTESEPTQAATEPEPTTQATTEPEPAQELTVPQAPEQVATPTEPKAVEAKTETLAEPVAETAAKTEAASAVQSSIDGQKIYKSICFSCHDFGVAAAPKPGDKAAWAPRLANGVDALYENALNGKGAMPAKGGNSALSDDEVKAAVDWMTAESK